MGDRVYHSRTDASAGRASGYKNGVDPARDQRRGERSAEKGGSILLNQQQILGFMLKPRVELHQLGADFQFEQGRSFLRPQPAVTGNFRIVSDDGKYYRCAALARRRDQPINRRYLTLETAGQRRPLG